MSRFDDETLMAYADGELAAELRAEIEAEMKRDAATALAVERHRALRARISEELGAPVDEPLPGSLARLLEPAAAGVIELDSRRRPRPPAARRWGTAQWSAMAASLALGVMAGLLWRPDAGSPLRPADGGLVAAGALERALDTQLAAEQGEQPLRVGLTYRDRKGRVCRTFAGGQPLAMAGLACREAGDWQLQVLARGGAASGELRVAAAMPPAVLQAVDASIDGEPFDAAAERAAQAAGWR